MLLVWCCLFGWAAATTVTLQVLGEPNVRVHSDNETIYLKSGTSARVRVCLVFSWMYVGARHTLRCSAAMDDCTCFTWQNAESGTECTDVWITGTAEFTWYLLPQLGAMVLPPTAVLQYAILRERWPNYTFAAFSTAYCMRVWPVMRPAVFMVTHRIPVITVTPHIHVADDITWMAIFIYICAAACMVWMAEYDGRRTP